MILVFDVYLFPFSEDFTLCEVDLDEVKGIEEKRLMEDGMVEEGTSYAEATDVVIEIGANGAGNGILCLTYLFVMSDGFLWWEGRRR